MAASAFTIVENVAVIESDSTGSVITKFTDADRTMLGLTGVLKNHGPSDVFLKVSVISGTPATTAGVVTTNAQAQLQCPLPVGGEFEWLAHYNSVAQKTDTAGKTSVLSWRPRGLK